MLLHGENHADIKICTKYIGFNAKSLLPFKHCPKSC